MRSTTATRFVEEHSVRGALPGGKTLDLAVCVVAEINGGKVTMARVYSRSSRGSRVDREHWCVCSKSHALAIESDFAVADSRESVQVENLRCP